jgi:Raf kinase inhibitor-like YbhB/YbcL family protein
MRLTKRQLSHFSVYFIISALVLSAAPEFTLSSDAMRKISETGFDSGLKSEGRMDPAYAAGENDPANTRSFPFSWKGLPSGTRALALIFDDPDAKKVMESYGMKGESFIHWMAGDIDPSLNELKANASAEKHGFVQGRNSGRYVGYMGPQPPSDFPKTGKKPLIHVYRLKVYALSAPTGLKDGFGLADLQAAIKDRTLGVAQLYISYSN